MATDSRKRYANIQHGITEFSSDYDINLTSSVHKILFIIYL